MSDFTEYQPVSDWWWVVVVVLYVAVLVWAVWIMSQDKETDGDGE